MQLNLIFKFTSNFIFHSYVQMQTKNLEVNKHFTEAG
jgi:hypothetical protein